MKFFVLAPVVAAVAFALPLSCVHAAANATDSAANYTGNYNNGNLGTGFGGAYLVNVNGASSNNAGAFLGSSADNGTGGTGNIDTGGQSFGLYANNGAGTLVNRTFSVGGPSGNAFLAPTQTFTLKFDNGFVDTGSSVGFNLLSSTGVDRFTFQFVGGNTAYTYNTGGADITTNVPFTANGLTIAFTQTASNTCYFTITPNGGTATQIITAVAATDIGQFQVFNNNAGSGTSNNLYFNSPTITSAPEPGTVAAVGVGAFGLLVLVRRRRTV